MAHEAMDKIKSTLEQVVVLEIGKSIATGAAKFRALSEMTDKKDLAQVTSDACDLATLAAAITNPWNIANTPTMEDEQKKKGLWILNEARCQAFRVLVSEGIEAAKAYRKSLDVVFNNTDKRITDEVRSTSITLANDIDAYIAANEPLLERLDQSFEVGTNALEEAMKAVA